ncbi:MAG: sigma-70 family RNA polymerase sigma factor [Thermoleophilia bacterium]
MIVTRGARLLRLASRMCPADAEDIVNIAAERALGRPEAFAHGDLAKLYRWLETTVRNECLRTLRDRRREHLTEPALLEVAAPDAVGAEPQAIRAEVEARIATLEAIAGLHPMEARCLGLSARGFSRAEIAQMLGITPLTVKRRLAEGRAALTDFGEDLASGRRCARIRPKLSDYLDADLADVQLRQIRLHLDHCGACRARLLAIRRQRASLGAALPPCLLLPAAERVEEASEEVRVGARLGQALDDRAVAAWAGFWTRVADGWFALGALGRAVGAGLAALLALAGIGTFAGHPAAERPPAGAALPTHTTPAREAASEAASAPASTGGRRTPSETTPPPPAAPDGDASTATAGTADVPGDPPEDEVAEAPSAGGGSVMPAMAPAPVVSAPAAPSPSAGSAPARAEFEPGP